MEVIVEIVVFLIFRYPGALLRWLFSRLIGSKKNFKSFLEDSVELNAIVGVLIMIVIPIMIYNL